MSNKNFAKKTSKLTKKPKIVENPIFGQFLTVFFKLYCNWFKLQTPTWTKLILENMSHPTNQLYDQQILKPFLVCLQW